MSPNDKSSKSSSSSVCIWVQPRPLPEMVPHLSGDQRLQLHRGTYWKEFSKCCNYIEPLPWCSENTWPNPTITLRHWKVFSKYWIMRTRCMTVEQTHLNFYRYIIFRKDILQWELWHADRPDLPFICLDQTSEEAWCIDSNLQGNVWEVAQLPHPNPGARLLLYRVFTGPP